MSAKVVGFFSMLVLLDSLQRRSLLNLLGASLFTLAISSSNQAAHGQLLCMSFAPLLTLIAVGWVRAIIASDNRATLVCGVAFISLFNALLMTSFYSTWFYALFALIFIVVAIVERYRDWRGWVALARHAALPLVVTAIWFVVTVFPFLAVYLPKLAQTGGQPYALQASFGVHPLDIFNIGPGSLVWGDLFARLTHVDPNNWRPTEFVEGVTPAQLL